MKKAFLSSKYRRNMWKKTQEILNIFKKNFNISSTYLYGSFTTKKKEPKDIDLIVLIKNKSKKSDKWAINVQIAPDNEKGKFILEDADKYKSVTKSKIIKLK